jgi:hypothetical protein
MPGSGSSGASGELSTSDPARSKNPGLTQHEREIQAAREHAQEIAAGTDPESEIVVVNVRGSPDTPSRWKHGGYVILAGREDGRSAVAKRMKQLAERVAVDAGYRTFAEMPAVRQAAVIQFARTMAASDAMWTSFMASGRLPDRFWDLVSLTRKYADLLGLDRTARDANVITLDDELDRLRREAKR